MLYEFTSFTHGIHLISSTLWWSITFFIVFIIRPANKNGSLSFILPKVQKIVITTATISIISGAFLFTLLSDFHVENLIHSTTGNIILISGSISLIVYFYILSNMKKKSKVSIFKNSAAMVRYIPFMLFFMLTLSMITMVVISKTTSW